MDRKRDPSAAAPAAQNCTYCDSQGKRLVGIEEERRQSRQTCRKCDAGYWGNQATGLIQQEVDDVATPE